MNTKWLLATLAGAVTMFLLGWVVYGMLLMDYFESNTPSYPGLHKDEHTMRLYGIFLSHLVTAGLYAYIFQRWAGIATMSRGFVGGMIIGGATTLALNLFLWSMLNLHPYPVYVVDTIVATVLSGIVGGVIGAVLGSGTKTATTRPLDRP